METKMERGKYERVGFIGISKEMDQILESLDYRTPETIRSVMKKINLEPSFSNKTSMIRSFNRLKDRHLIKSLGRNSLREYLWVKLQE